MKIIPQQEEIFKGTVREAMAINPIISVRKIQKVVEERHKRSISDKYASKLMWKVRRGVIVESDRRKINERLAEVRERYRTNIDYLTRCIYWDFEFLNKYGIQEPTLKEKILAIKAQSKLESDLFKLEVFAGLFESKQAAINEMLSQGVLPMELQEQVVGVFRSWKMGPAQAKQGDVVKI